tara:strand:+ start:1292 stop:1720 length:429 start_codon:yes stop_codon:yes gene_type:complete
MIFDVMSSGQWSGLNPVWLFEVVVVSVYDGDTFTGNIDQGFSDFKMDQKFRITNMGSKWDTPEIRGSLQKEKELAIEARDYMAEQLGSRCVVYSHRGTGMYGRWLVTPFHYQTGANICDQMNELGLSRNYQSSKRPAWRFSK